MSTSDILGSHISAPVARERLQVLLAHERNSTRNSDLVAILRKEILSAISKHISIGPDKVQVKMQRHDHTSVLKIDCEIESPPTMPVIGHDVNETSHPDDVSRDSPQLSPGRAAANPLDQTHPTPTNMERGRNFRLSWHLAAGSIIVMAGLAWRVAIMPYSSNKAAISPNEETRLPISGENQLDTGPTQAKASEQAPRIVSVPQREISPGGGGEMSIGLREAAPTRPAREMSLEPGVGPGIMAPSQKVGGAPDDFTRVKLPNGDEMSVQRSGVETKLFQFLEQASNKRGEFELIGISFDAASATLSPSSSEQVQNVAKILNAYLNTRIDINAYFDNVGHRSSGLRLSRKRAHSVLRELARSGVEKSRMAVQVNGGKRVTSSAGSEEGKGRDQRISFTVTRR